MIGRRVSFWIVAYSIFLLLAGATIPTPLFIVYQERLGFSDGVLTLIFAVYTVGVLFSLLFVGRLSDKVGRKTVLLPALGLAAAGSLAFVFADSVSLLLFARILQGLGIGSATGAGLAALAELEPSGDHRHSARIGATATVSGLAVGPLFAGVLVEYVFWPLVLVFLLYLGLVSMAILGVFRMPETVGNRKMGVSLRPQRLTIPRRSMGPFVLASVAVFGAFAVVAVYQALGPSIANALLGVSNRAVGGAVVFALLGTSAAGQLGARNWPIVRAVVTGAALLAGGLALILVSLFSDSVGVFLVGTLLAGFGHGLAFLGSQQLVDQVSPEERRAEIFSAFYVVLYLGATLPALGVGFGAGLIGFLPAVVVFAALIGLLNLATGFVAARFRLPDEECEVPAVRHH